MDDTTIFDIIKRADPTTIRSIISTCSLYNNTFLLYKSKFSKHPEPTEFPRQLALANPEAVNWTTVSKHYKLSVADLRACARYLNWSVVCRYQYVPQENLLEFSDIVDWTVACQYQRMSPDFLHKNSQLINWKVACRYQILSEDLVEEHMRLVNWRRVCYFGLSADFLLRNSKQIPWGLICKHAPIRERKVFEHIMKLRSTGRIPEKKKCITASKISQESYSFLKEFAELFDWPTLVKHNKNFTCEFLHEMALIVGTTVETTWNQQVWDAISQYSQLYSWFIIEHCDQLNWELLAEHQKLSPMVMVKFAKRIPWAIAAKHQSISRKLQTEIDAELMIVE